MSFPGSMSTDLELVLLLTLGILLNSCTFFDSICEWLNSWRLKVIFMTMAPQRQREKAGSSPCPARQAFLSRVHFLPCSWLHREFLGMVKGWELLCVCKPAAATDLWTWHAWEYHITMATANKELDSISGRDPVSQTDNVLGLANCPQRRMWKLVWINFHSLGQRW